MLLSIKLVLEIHPEREYMVSTRMKAKLDTIETIISSWKENQDGLKARLAPQDACLTWIERMVKYFLTPLVGKRLPRSLKQRYLMYECDEEGLPSGGNWRHPSSIEWTHGAGLISLNWESLQYCH